MHNVTVQSQNFDEVRTTGLLDFSFDLPLKINAICFLLIWITNIACHPKQLFSKIKKKE